MEKTEKWQKDDDFLTSLANGKETSHKRRFQTKVGSINYVEAIFGF